MLEKKKIGSVGIVLDIKEDIKYGSYLSLKNYVEKYGYPEEVYPVSVWDINKGLYPPLLFAEAGARFDIDSLADKILDSDSFLCVLERDARNAEKQGRITKRRRD